MHALENSDTVEHAGRKSSIDSTDNHLHTSSFFAGRCMFSPPIRSASAITTHALIVILIVVLIFVIIVVLIVVARVPRLLKPLVLRC